MSAQNFETTFREDGTAAVILRISGRGCSGDATGVAGEGNWAEQADLSTITYRVFDETDSNVEVTAGAQSVTIATSLADTPVTGTSALWDRDPTGYNFTHNLPATCFPTGGHLYRVEYKFTFADGSIGWGVIRGRAEQVLSS